VAKKPYFGGSKESPNVSINRHNPEKARKGEKTKDSTTREMRGKEQERVTKTNELP